jgi:hypothetical protein
MRKIPQSPPKGPIAVGPEPGKPGSYSSGPPKPSPSIPKPPASKSDIEINTTKTTKSRPFVGKFKKGGKVQRTGVALVHSGERILTAKQSKKYKKTERKKTTHK